MTATIFALASAGGRAGIAVFRLSGPASGPTLTALSGQPLPPPRLAQRTEIKDQIGRTIDDGLALWFPAPHSFTGDDVVELHLHGGRAVADALSETLLAHGLRPAERGEFSHRAVLAGKMDLVQAEAIADLIDAETEAQRRQARRQMEGPLSTAVEAWRTRLLRLRAHIEAEIDFSEEELPEGLASEARIALDILANEMAATLADGRRGERMRHGFQVALLGAPNVGKSSLLNRIAGRDAAIVSAFPGTTRDVIEVHLDLSGYPVTLADTAGLRVDPGEIEAEGIKRSRLVALDADLVLIILSTDALADAESLAMIDAGGLAVMNKMDLGMRLANAPPFIGVSAQSGAGIDALLATIAERAAQALDQGEGSSPPLNRPRYRAAITEARLALLRALNAPLPELAAEDVRVAGDALGRITGRVDIEDMLGLIFSEFCIGK